MQEHEAEIKGERLELADDEEPDCAFAASHLLDVMPNPWRGNEIAHRVFDSLLKRYDRRRVLDGFVYVLDEMHRQLLHERDRLSREVFEKLLKEGTMRFMVVTDDLSLKKDLQVGVNKLPQSLTIHENEVRANSDKGMPHQKSLFDEMPEASLNGLEQSVATFLDAQEALFFWYRNQSKEDFYVQGWQPNKIYADFVFTTTRQANNKKDKEMDRVFVVETKGRHLAGVRDAQGRTTDTGYKTDIFALCTELAQEKTWNDCAPFLQDMRFEVVDEDGWKARLNELLQGATV